jgi:hypothetical protein
MKLIKVDCCGNCPHNTVNSEDAGIVMPDFNKCGIAGMFTNDLSIIHPGCPLENAKEDS